MNRILGAVFAVLLGLGLSIPDSEAARRLGGGKSFGTQRQATPQQPAPRQEQAPQAAPQQPGAKGAPAAAGSRWLGPVAGLLAGGLLGALIFGGAFEGIKLMDVVLILLLAAGLIYLFRTIARKPQTPQRREPLQYAGVGAEPRLDPLPQAQPATGSAAAAADARYFPAGFDAEAFARQAKANFVRLQEANDRADLNALREVMTPELFSEIEAEIRSRGTDAQKIEVVTLDAKVIEVVSEGDHYIASVRFTGLIKEDPAGAPESFSELWHLQKPIDGSSGWLMAGIQQD